MSRLHGAETDEYGRKVTRIGEVTIIEVPRQDDEVLSAEGRVQSEGQGTAGMEAPQPWGPLPGREPPGAFPYATLPPLMDAAAVTVADAVQVSYDMAACMVLGAVSTAAAGRVSVRVNGSYQEPCHLYVAVGANPSERKSACMDLVFRPLYEFEREENERRAPAIRHYAETKELLEDQLTRAKKGGERQRMADLIDELNGLEEVRLLEMILTDATPEALSKAMARNGGRMALVSSEGAFFNILAGGYSTSGAANVDVVLKGYSGEPVRVERIGRPGEKIDKACLSMCLAVQPDMLHDFLSDATLSGRGMASRFLAAMPRSLVGSRVRLGIPVNYSVLERYGLRLRELLSLPAPLEVTLARECDEVCEAWFQEIEKELNPGGALAEVGQGWGGKLYGNTLRLAGLMTLMREQVQPVISADTMRAAVSVARWFRDHALCLMGGEDSLSPEANEALAWLVRHGEAAVKETKVSQALRRRRLFGKMDVIQSALTDLHIAGFVRLMTPAPSDGPGRPQGRVIHLHPALLNRGTP